VGIKVTQKLRAKKMKARVVFEVKLPPKQRTRSNSATESKASEWMAKYIETALARFPGVEIEIRGNQVYLPQSKSPLFAEADFTDQFSKDEIVCASLFRTIRVTPVSSEKTFVAPGETWTVNAPNQTTLQGIIEGKSEKLKDYKKCDQQWLLIATRLSPAFAADLKAPISFSNTIGAFDLVWLMDSSTDDLHCLDAERWSRVSKPLVQIG